MENVQILYKKYLADGYTPKDAAKRAQEETGFSTVTGQPIKQKKVSFSSKGVTYGRKTIKSRGFFR